MTKKFSQTDCDLMEVECALRAAHLGGPVIWSAAREALQRLFDEHSEQLPKTYTVAVE